VQRSASPSHSISEVRARATRERTVPTGQSLAGRLRVGKSHQLGEDKSLAAVVRQRVQQLGEGDAVVEAGQLARLGAFGGRLPVLRATLLACACYGLATWLLPPAAAPGATRNPRALPVITLTLGRVLRHKRGPGRRRARVSQTPPRRRSVIP
jgi:hypothetical protein